LDENGKAVKNIARLVAKVCSLQKGIDYKETYAHVTPLEEMRNLLSFVAHSNMKLYQMDVKYKFLDGLIQEEVYVEQPLGFESDTLPHHVFILNKALYGLKQAPQSWFEKLSSFLLENGIKRGKWIQLCFVKIKTHNLY